MRIGIDGYITSPGQGGFIGYVSRLVEALASLGADELHLYLPSKARVEFPELIRLPTVTPRIVEYDVERVPDRRQRDVVWHTEVLPAALAEDPPDVCFGPCQFIPIGWPGPTVVTIHDLVFERHPEFYTAANLGLYRTWKRRVAEAADAIVTVSESTAADIRRLWDIGTSGDKPVVATPLASALRFRPDDPELSRRIVGERLGVNRPYVLSVAARHRRKNLDGALRGFAKLPARVRDGTRLVLVGLRPEQVADKVAAHGLERYVVPTGDLSDELLAHVYAAAEVLLHPTFYEGFGLPVLEAMSCGTAVVSSTRPAIPEVAGSAAVLVDPTDDAAIADGLERVLTDVELRTRLETAGRLRSRRFDWRRTAELTRGVLEEAIELHHVRQ